MQDAEGRRDEACPKTSEPAGGIDVAQAVGHGAVGGRVVCAAFEHAGFDDPDGVGAGACQEAWSM